MIRRAATWQAVMATKATSSSVEARGKGGHAAREQTRKAWLQACDGIVAVVRSKAGREWQLSSCESVKQKK